ncbi:MAG TPA: hypothetical protein PKV80_22700, partial [Leptospiraceae bacterium]|nr:hypothetical protein [Leptospiraceae bacterium]
DFACIASLSEDEYFIQNNASSSQVLSRALNSSYGAAIDVLISVFKSEPYNKKVKNALRNCGLSTNTAKQALIAQHIADFFNRDRGLAIELMQFWITQKIESSLSLSLYIVPYFDNEESIIKTALETSFEIIENKKARPEEFGQESLPFQFFITLVHLAYIGQESYLENYKEKVFSGSGENNENLQHCMLNAMFYHRNNIIEKDFFWNTLKQASRTPSSKTSSRLLIGLCDEEVYKGREEKCRELILQILRSSDIRKDFYQLTENFRNLSAGDADWVIQISEIFLQEFSYGVREIAEVLTEFYEQQPSKQKEIFPLLEKCLDRGWDGFDRLLQMGI